MSKQINIFVKGKTGVGKTTFINTIRDILKKNKKFKENFEGYEFNIYEVSKIEDEEIQSATNKKWTITEGTFEETEFFNISYKKSFLQNIWSLIKVLFKKILKIFRIIK